MLLARARAEPEIADTDQRYGDQPLSHALSHFHQDTILSTLESLALPVDSPLSVLVVEIYRGALDSRDPLGVDLGQVRIVRASPLTQVPPMCVAD